MLNSTRTKLSKQKFLLWFFFGGRFLWSHLAQELNPRSPNYSFIVTIHFRLYYINLIHHAQRIHWFTKQPSKWWNAIVDKTGKKLNPRILSKNFRYCKRERESVYVNFGSENSKWRFILTSRHGISRGKKISCRSNIWGNIKSIYGYYRGTETA